MTQFAVEVGHSGLRASQRTDDQIAHLTEPFGEQAQGGAFSGTAIAGHQGKAAFADLLFHAPAEVLKEGKSEQSRSGDLWGEGIKFEAVEALEFFTHKSVAGLEVVGFLGR